MAIHWKFWEKRGDGLDRAPNGQVIKTGLYQADQWMNMATGLGSNRDKVYSGTYWAPMRLQDTELLALYNGSDLAARICETVPKETLRRGYELTVDDQDASGLLKKADELRVNELFVDAGTWGNLFGGAILIVGVEDGQDPSEPLDEERIRTVRYLNVIDRRFIFVHRYYNDPLSPKYGLPEQYLVTNGVGGVSSAPGAVVIHESRVIRFDGARTDILTRQQLAGWTWSVLQRAYDPLRAFESGFQAVANLMSDASQAVFKIQNLISMIASGEKENLQTRMALVDQSRSVCRAVLLDAEKEDFARQPTSFAGLPELLDRFMMRLSAAVEIPVTILLGRSAAGMNATGDADFRAFYDRLATEQENMLKPKLKRLFYLMACAKDSGIVWTDESEIDIKFHALWQPSDVEQADVELKTAQKDQIYATIGALLPEEIKLSRWGKGRFSTETDIDVTEAKNALSDERMFGNMLNPPQNLAGTDAPGQGEQQTGVTQLPGPVGGQAGYSLGGAAYVGKDTFEKK